MQKRKCRENRLFYATEFPIPQDSLGHIAWFCFYCSFSFFLFSFSCRCYRRPDNLDFAWKRSWPIEAAAAASPRISARPPLSLSPEEQQQQQQQQTISTADFTISVLALSDHAAEAPAPGWLAGSLPPPFFAYRKLAHFLRACAENAFLALFPELSRVSFIIE